MPSSALDAAAAAAAAQVDPGQLTVIFSVGDLEALHDVGQMAMVHGPAKYRTLGDFPQGARRTTVLPAAAGVHRWQP